MKVKIRPYVCSARWSWKYFLGPLEELLESIEYIHCAWVIDRLENSRFAKVLDWLGEKVSDWQERRRVNVCIDDYDVYSMDSTLTYIIIPMLKRLKGNKHGAPMVDDSEVPEMLRSTNDPDFDPNNKNGQVDKYFFRRWDWVMNEMIWAFEAHQDDWPMMSDIPFDESTRGFYKAAEERKANGFKLFGKYYQNLWD